METSLLSVIWWKHLAQSIASPAVDWNEPQVERETVASAEALELEWYEGNV